MKENFAPIGSDICRLGHQFVTLFVEVMEIFRMYDLIGGNMSLKMRFDVYSLTVLPVNSLIQSSFWRFKIRSFSFLLQLPTVMPPHAIITLTLELSHSRTVS